MITKISSPYHTKCDWCGLEIEIVKAIGVVRIFEVFRFEPGSSSPELESTREEKLYFCNRSHKQEYLYGV